MSLQQVTIIDQKRQVVATAQVTEQDGTFTGRIDLSPMSVPRRRQFEAYEEIVSQQMFSLLDEMEEKIEAMLLKVRFADGHVAPLADLQIYPSTKKVSFKLEYRRVQLLRAVFCFIFARSTYLEMAICHGMAVNLEAPDLRKKYVEGTFPSPNWRDTARQEATEAANDLQRKILSALYWVLVAAGFAIVVGFFDRSLGFDLEPNFEKVIPFVGTCLAGWATLMELGGALVTWKGEALHELIHPIIFQLLFIPGVALLLISFVL